MGKKSRRNRVKGRSAPEPKQTLQEDDHGLLDCISEIVSHLSSFDTSSETDDLAVCHAIKFLHDFIHEFEHRATRAFLQTGGVGKLLNAMKEMLDRNATALVTGQIVLFSVVLKEELEVERAIFRAGGIPTMLAAMRNICEAEMPEQLGELVGSAVLTSLLMLGDMADDQSMAAAVVQAGGIQASISFMRNQVTEGKTQGHIAQYALDLIAKLMFYRRDTLDWDTLRLQIVACGGIPNILECMEQYPENEKIQWHGCSLMSTLSNLQCLLLAATTS